MLKLLHDRVKSGVDVRVIGKVAKSGQSLAHEKYPGTNLHARVIIRDHRDAFLGSQSLRKLELDKRREVGILVKHAAIVTELVQTFEEDWAQTDSGRRAKRKGAEESDRSDRRTRREAQAEA
jgi:phosphatidylserine/phosphatidylglycerophosphate/cardiolipin synthase-like enzyme